MKVVAVVGMCGAGKSEVAVVFERYGFRKVRFGDLTERELSRRGLEQNEENERRVREELRGELGMAAYARLSLPAIGAALEKSNVVIDGLYSWDEYTLLKGHYGDSFFTLAVYASPKTREKRLCGRAVRPLTPRQVGSRDVSEIVNLAKGGPIAMADCTLVNESTLEELRRETVRIINLLTVS
ncbi:MAG: AAA family ATPase [Chloroflexota bacterium]